MNIISLRNKFSIDTILLLVILLTAAILRFWNFPNMPYMHDELSALARTHYSNLYDEIYYGVAKMDTHPAGVQLFIYYWIKIMGDGEMAVKFPFIVCGLLSIFVVYKISKFWFNSSVGIIVASFMSVMQYFVMYSQLARPYISGVLLTLLMVWCWSNYLFRESSQSKIKWIIGYLFSTVLCAYDHHFALLFAIIVCMTGIFFLKKINWKGYLIAAISAILLYIPHIKIFFIQFNKGGLGGSEGWLSKPDSDWFLHFIKYTFHYSYEMYVLGFGILLLSFIYSQEITTKQKFRLISLIWFFTVFFIEYFYSVYVNPILQFSTIIFVFPFLLMFVFSLAGELSVRVKTIVVTSIMVVGITTLIFNRKHFTLFYHQSYQEQITNTFKLIDEIGDEKKATIELLMPVLYSDYYFKKYNRKFNYRYYNPFDEKPDSRAFKEFVNKQTTDYFIFGNPPLQYLQLIKEKYPFMICKEEGFGYSYYCFAKQKPIAELHDEIVFSKKYELEDAFKQMDSTKEYGKSFTEKLKNIVPKVPCIITARTELSTSDTISNPLLVADVQDDGESLYWNGAEYMNYKTKFDSSFVPVYISKLYSDWNLKEHVNAQIILFVWNKSKKKVSANTITLEVTKSNPSIYSLFEPIE